MRKFLLTVATIGGLAALGTTGAFAGPPAEGFHRSQAQPQATQVDYYWNHRHWQHRHWEHAHHHWRYYD